jgi:hypothetical protein
MTDVDANLIERLEKLTGPDRGFDDIIAEAAGYTKHFGNTGRTYLTWSTPGGEYIGVAPRFTGSIDAALTLVPKGWQVEQLTWQPIPSGLVVAFIGNFGDGPLYKTTSNDLPAPPAIALCIAALRARESQP